MTIRYQPTEVGLHLLEVTYNNEPIPGSPFKFHVDAINSGFVTAYGPGLTHGISGEQSYFTIVTKDAGAGTMSPMLSIFHLYIAKSLKRFFITQRKTEPGNSAIECGLEIESPGSNSSLCYRFETWTFSFYSRHPSPLSCINEYLVIYSSCMTEFCW